MIYKPHFTLKDSLVPVLKNEAIERDAMIFVNQYDPDLLVNPHPFDIEGFLEFYLNLSVDFIRVKPDGSVLGEMIFKNSINVPSFNKDDGGVEFVDLRGGTIILDPSLGKEGEETLLRTTEAHECGHWIYHQAYFGEQMDKEDVYSVACRRVDISFSNRNKALVSDEDWLEHHAKYFSGCLLMPRKAVFAVIKDEKLRNLAWNDVRRYHFASIGNGRLAKAVAETFNVSERAAQIRLEQLGCDLASEAKAKKEPWMIQLIEQAMEVEVESCF